jgi:ribosomal protein L37AE/L43A
VKAKTKFPRVLTERSKRILRDLWRFKQKHAIELLHAKRNNRGKWVCGLCYREFSDAAHLETHAAHLHKREYRTALRRALEDATIKYGGIPSAVMKAFFSHARRKLPPDEVKQIGRLKLHYYYWTGNSEWNA